MSKPRNLAAIAVVYGAIACGKKYVDPQEEARKQHCPELKTWADCDEKLRAASATKKEADVSGANAEMDAAFKSYDGKGTPDQQALKAIMARSAALAGGLPSESIRLQFIEAQAVEFRKRGGPLFAPESFSDSPPEWRTLVPSKDAAKCGVWASMWANEDEKFASLVRFGFRKIQCGEKVWELALISRVCWLYEKASPNSSVLVWDSGEAAAEAVERSKWTDYKGTRRMQAHVTNHGQRVAPGGRFEIVGEWNEFVRVEGREAQKGTVGFVSPSA